MVRWIGLIVIRYILQVEVLECGLKKLLVRQMCSGIPQSEPVRQYG